MIQRKPAESEHKNPCSNKILFPLLKKGNHEDQRANSLPSRKDPLNDTKETHLHRSESEKKHNYKP